MTQEPVPETVHQLFGDPDPLVVAGGHSHTAALIRAMHETPFDPDAKRVAVAYTSDWSAPSTDAYFEYLVEVASGRSVALSFSGNEHNRRFLIRSQQPFRVYDPQARVELGPEHGAWLPRSAFRELWVGSFELLHALIPRLAKRSTVYVTATPPPKSDELSLAALGSEPYFVQQAAQLGYDRSSLQVTPAITRVALWRVLDDLLREAAEAGGAIFVPVPEETTDGDGVLLPEFDVGDVTHANGRYGALVWDQLLHLATLEETP